MTDQAVDVEVFATNPHHFVKTVSGVTMPKLIYGTAWKKDQTAGLVIQAVRAGFRGIDTAGQPRHYNEPGVGEALKTLFQVDKMPRESLFIQTKFTSLSGQDPNNIPYDKKAPLELQVQQSLASSLLNLGVTYIDSLVMHGPMSAEADTMTVWKVFETFVDAGKVRQLGMSNMYSLQNFQKLYDAVRIKPSVLQNRLYEETGYDKDLREFCKEKRIFYQSFWTITANPQILGHKNVKELAKRREKTPEQLFFAYLMQTGVVTPLTGTKSEKHMKEDLEALDLELTDEEKKVFDDLIN